MENPVNHTNLPYSRAALGSLLSLGVASSAQGVILPGNDFTLSSNQSINWDIDGDTVSDFRANALTSTSSSTGFIALASNDYAGGLLGRLAATAGSALASLTTNAVVDSNYAFITRVAASINSSSTNTQNLSNIAKSTPTVIGFSFEKSGSTHYGIGTFEYFVDLSTASLSVTNVLWNDVAGQGITGAGTAVVPEPANAALGLGALALGAAGLRRMRKSKAV